MAGALGTARRLAEAWARKPSRAAAEKLRKFYASRARHLPLHARAELCVALAEAAELDGRFETARYLYASAVSAIDPEVDERAYARAAVRALLNASRLFDLPVLQGVAKLVEGLGLSDLTPRLAGLGATARGLERLLRQDPTGARRAFEAAMSAAWESHDADAEALAHHLLGQAWVRVGRMARAKEHVEAARAAAKRANSWILEQRLEIESIMFGLVARVTPEALARARSVLSGIRRLGFARLEALAWSKLARGLLSERPHAEAFLSRSEELLPAGHPDRAFLAALRRSMGSGNGRKDDARLKAELDALAKLAKG
jgi:hypothetical protein